MKKQAIWGFAAGSSNRVVGAPWQRWCSTEKRLHRDVLLKGGTLGMVVVGGIVGSPWVGLGLGRFTDSELKKVGAARGANITTWVGVRVARSGLGLRPLLSVNC